MKVNRLLGNMDLVKDPLGGYRGTGRSMGIALETIGRAMVHPCKAIKIKDHHDSRNANRDLLNKIATIIESLGLKGFVIKSYDESLTFDPYEWLPDGPVEEVTINGNLYRRV